MQGVPALPGLYRIRRVGLPHWDYVGQTGTGRMNLRRRMAMLRAIYGEQMPYRDPHTAGPGLWALRQGSGEPLKVSFCPVDVPTPWRKGLEAVAIAIHRQDHGPIADAQLRAHAGRLPHVLCQQRTPRRGQQETPRRSE